MPLLSRYLPVVVECVDTETKIQEILPELDRMIGGGLITLERARVIAYRGATEYPAMPTPYEALAQVANACQPLPNLVTGGQPDVAQLEAFKAAGGDVVLDLRGPDEPRPMNEPETAQRLGLEYISVPVTAETRTDATLERIREVLRSTRGRTVFYHCRSGSRVGAGLIPYLVLDEGMDEDAAVEKALQVGLSNPDHLRWALDYVHRVKGSSSRS